MSDEGNIKITLLFILGTTAIVSVSESVREESETSDCGLERRPYFFVPMTSFGDISRPGESGAPCKYSSSWKTSVFSEIYKKNSSHKRSQENKTMWNQSTTKPTEMNNQIIKIINATFLITTLWRTQFAKSHIVCRGEYLRVTKNQHRLLTQLHAGG